MNEKKLSVFVLFVKTEAVILSLGSVIFNVTFVHDAPSDAFAFGPECTDNEDEWKQIHPAMVADSDVVI